MTRTKSQQYTKFADTRQYCETNLGSYGVAVVKSDSNSNESDEKVTNIPNSPDIRQYCETNLGSYGAVVVKTDSNSNGSGEKVNNIPNSLILDNILNQILVHMELPLRKTIRISMTRKKLKNIPNSQILDNIVTQILAHMELQL